MKLGCCDLTPHPHPPQDGRDFAELDVALDMAQEEYLQVTRPMFKTIICTGSCYTSGFA